MAGDEDTSKGDSHNRPDGTRSGRTYKAHMKPFVSRATRMGREIGGRGGPAGRGSAGRGYSGGGRGGRGDRNNQGGRDDASASFGPATASAVGTGNEKPASTVTFSPKTRATAKARPSPRSTSTEKEHRKADTATGDDFDVDARDTAVPAAAAAALTVTGTDLAPVLHGEARASRARSPTKSADAEEVTDHTEDQQPPQDAKSSPSATSSDWTVSDHDEETLLEQSLTIGGRYKYYHPQGGDRSGEIIKILETHHDDPDGPYFTIRFESDDHEKQTSLGHIQPLLLDDSQAVKPAATATPAESYPTPSEAPQYPSHSAAASGIQRTAPQQPPVSPSYLKTATSGLTLDPLTSANTIKNLLPSVFGKHLQQADTLHQLESALDPLLNRTINDAVTPVLMSKVEDLLRDDNTKQLLRSNIEAMVASVHEELRRRSKQVDEEEQKRYDDMARLNGETQDSLSKEIRLELGQLMTKQQQENRNHRDTIMTQFNERKLSLEDGLKTTGKNIHQNINQRHTEVVQELQAQSTSLKKKHANALDDRYNKRAKDLNKLVEKATEDLQLKAAAKDKELDALRDTARDVRNEFETLHDDVMIGNDKLFDAVYDKVGGELTALGEATIQEVQENVAWTTVAELKALTQQLLAKVETLEQETKDLRQLLDEQPTDTPPPLMSRIATEDNDNLNSSGLMFQGRPINMHAPIQARQSDYNVSTQHRQSTETSTLSKFLRYKIPLEKDEETDLKVFCNLLKAHGDASGIPILSMEEARQSASFRPTNLPEEQIQTYSLKLCQYLMQAEVLTTDSRRITAIKDLHTETMDGYHLLDDLMRVVQEMREDITVASPVLSKYTSINSYLGAYVKFYKHEHLADRSYSAKEQSLAFLNGLVESHDYPEKVRTGATTLRRLITNHPEDQPLPKSYKMINLTSTLQKDYGVIPEDLLAPDAGGVAFRLYGDDEGDDDEVVDGVAQAADGSGNRRQGDRYGGRRDNKEGRYGGRRDDRSNRNGRRNGPPSHRPHSDARKSYRKYEARQCPRCGIFGHGQDTCQFMPKMLVAQEAAKKMTDKEKKNCVLTWMAANKKSTLEARAHRLEAETGDSLPIHYLTDEAVVEELRDYQLEETDF